MALVTIARRLQRTHLKHSLPSLLHSSLAQPPLPSSPSSNQFSQTFYQTQLVLSRPFPQNPYFSTLQPSHHQNLHETIDFSESIDEAHQNNQLGVRELVEALKNADQFSSEGEAIEFLDENGVEPNEDLVYWAVWALRDEWELAFVVFKWGEKWGCLGEKNWTLMIWVLGSHKKFSTAWCLVRDLYRSSSVDTRRPMLVLIDRFTAANDPGKAIQTFQIMEKFRMTPDLKAFHTLLNALCKHGNIEEAEEFMLLNKKFFPLETESFNIILNGWCNISVDVFEAKRIWREMSRCCITPDATSYTHMISCFSKVGNLFDSLRLYDEMKKRGWVPGIEVYNSLIYILARENCLKEALKILNKMKEAGVQPNSASYNSMICPLCEATKLDEARTILATMVGENVRPTIETYHAFLEGASVDGTLEVLNHMKKASLGPNPNTFLLIFGKFFKLKQPENALRIWVEMMTYGIVPDSAHYALLVEGLATCGLLIKARELYAEMRLNGILDDPKLKKLLKKPAQHSSHQREEPMTVVRNIKKGTQVHPWKRSVVMRRKKHGKQPRKTTSVT
ncbi:pentatricopeptide repeat-containing protein At1g80880, mitochondrial isoform X2 [Camellia sinensis]|uniref:pentatricopeptide repeat-containing protein At1g80880, mitochondrial isoform X2 n=1 Tax=Camellia sinensis TaxID=4442 RepID=UPI0010369CBC|nr:pentatricopeptide repeat-containing protein At1g80880, mitochondrial isoform X2 [Camellia sinensis]